MSFQTLPDLVVRRILQFTIGDNCIHNLYSWTEALPLILTCHNWRAFLKHDVCRSVYVAIDDINLSADGSFTMNFYLSMLEAQDNPDSDDDYDPSDPEVMYAMKRDKNIRVQSNFLFFKENNALDLVKKFDISDERPDYFEASELFSVFVGFMRAFYPDLDGCPGVADITEWSEAMMLDNKPVADVVTRCHEACKNIAKDIVCMLPRVNDILIEIRRPHEFFQRAIVELIAGFEPQLSAMDCCIPPYLPMTMSNPNLSTINLSLYAGGIGVVLPKIYPQHVRNLELKLGVLEFDWDMFQLPDNSSGTIVFKNLDSLIISSDMASSDIMNRFSHAVPDGMLALEFPKLRVVALENVPLTKQTVRALVQPSLKGLHFLGEPDVASFICDQQIGGLDYFQIILDIMDVCFGDHSMFINAANEIFQKTAGIPLVRLVARDTQYAADEMDDSDFDKVDWPHLTHLHFDFGVPFKALLKAVLSMPELVELSINIGACERDYAKDMLRLFKNIKRIFPQGSSSKVETIELICNEQECEFKDILEQIKQNVMKLKWYLPKLATVKVGCYV